MKNGDARKVALVESQYLVDDLELAKLTLDLDGDDI